MAKTKTANSMRQSYVKRDWLSGSFVATGPKYGVRIEKRPRSRTAHIAIERRKTYFQERKEEFAVLYAAQHGSYLAELVHQMVSDQIADATQIAVQAARRQMMMIAANPSASSDAASSESTPTERQERRLTPRYVNATPEEKIAAFLKWSNESTVDVVLPDDAFDRESMYEDRG